MSDGEARPIPGARGAAAVFAGALFIIFLVGRIVLVVLHRGRPALMENLGGVFFAGLRLDLSLVCVLLALPLLLTASLPALLDGLRRRVLLVWYGVWVSLAFVLEGITWGFMEEFSQRPNRLLLEAARDPFEILSTVWDRHGLFLLVFVPVLIVALHRFLRVLHARLRDEGTPSVPLRAGLLVAGLPLLFLGARGTLDHRPLNPSCACVSADPLVNQLGMSSLYSMGYAIYCLRHEESPDELYGAMPAEEMWRRVLSYAPGGAKGAPSEKAIPLWRTKEDGGRSGPLNLVIILEESMGARFVGCLGGASPDGRSLTPRFDALAGEGTLFADLRATGTRTVRGIEAVVSGFLPTPGRSVVKLGGSQTEFFTVADLLRRHGYRTSFVYGGHARFDNMKRFFTGNGFETIMEEDDFPPGAYRGIWGVSDDELFDHANGLFRDMGKTPFFSLLLTTSNHTPFDFPTKDFVAPEKPLRSVRNAIAFADFALGRFFDAARREAYFSRTVFLVVADHDVRVSGNTLVPTEQFRIPGLVIGPGFPAKRLSVLASQIDLLPTILPRLGLSLTHPCVGRDLLALESDARGRAIMQYHTNHGFLVGDRLVVHRPGQAATHLRRVDGRFVPCEGDVELERDALAHALLPGWLYRQHVYRTPEQKPSR